MFIVKFIFMFTLLVGTASAETEPKLPDEYLGIALGASINQIKPRIPIECKNHHTIIGCNYYGNEEKNSKYKLMKNTKEITLVFENDSLSSIQIFFYDISGFSNLLALFENSAGSPIVTSRPGLISTTKYTWENSKVINELSRIRGTSLKGNPFDNYFIGIRLKK